MVATVVAHPEVDRRALSYLASMDTWLQTVEQDLEETMTSTGSRGKELCCDDDYRLAHDEADEGMTTWDYRQEIDMKNVVGDYWPEIPGVTVVVADGHNNYAWPTVSEYVAQVGEKFDDILIG